MYHKKRKFNLSGYFFFDCNWATRTSIFLHCYERFYVHWGRIMYNVGMEVKTILSKHSRYSVLAKSLPGMMRFFFPLETFCGPHWCKDAFSMLEWSIWHPWTGREETGPGGSPLTSYRLQDLPGTCTVVKPSVWPLVGTCLWFSPGGTPGDA